MSRAPRQPTRATVLQNSLSTLRAAGASPEALEAIERDAAEAKRQASEARPLGARLDAAAARARKAAASVEKAEAAVEAAMARRATAIAEEAAAQVELASAREAAAEEAAEVPLTVQAVIDGARDLLGRLERSRVLDPITGGPPEAVLEAMRALSSALDATGPGEETDMEDEDSCAAEGPHPPGRAAAASDASGGERARSNRAAPY